MMNSILIYSLDQVTNEYDCALIPWDYNKGYEDILAILQVQSANITSFVGEMEFWAFDNEVPMPNLPKVKISAIGQIFNFKGSVLIAATDKKTGYPRGLTMEERYWLQEYMTINDQVISNID